MMRTSYKNLSATVGGSIALALTATLISPSAQATTQWGATATSSPSASFAGPNRLSDTQLQQGIRTLEKLPAGLKNANPATTPNYEGRLKAEILKIKTQPASGTRYVNWFSCGLALGGDVVEYGVPVGKVVGWLKDEYKIFGGVKGLLNAIRSDAAAAEIGEDAAKVLGGLLDVDDVVKACS